MDKNQGYVILKAVMLENGRGFALGENPKAVEPFVTWACYDDKVSGKREYEWGHYGKDRAALVRAGRYRMGHTGPCDSVLHFPRGPAASGGAPAGRLGWAVRLHMGLHYGVK